MNKMHENSLYRLQTFGQDLWLDFISRAMVVNNDLAKMINNDGLSGVTSNPTLFEKAIEESQDYDDSIRHEVSINRSAREIASSLILYDITAVADQFKTLYEYSNGKRGFVSIEVSPHLARDTGGTIRDARSLWNSVNRPNIFIKIPATREGVPAIRELIGEGINVNVTLLFGLTRYREVAQAYIEGIENRIDRGESVENVQSVASFFLSRIDMLVDRMLDKRIADGGDIGKRSSLLKGKIALASAVSAYHIFKKIFKDRSFARLAQQGAHPQRLLWASLSTKNPQYSDTMYVDALIGPDTISTQPLETIEAFRAHGSPVAHLEESVAAAQKNLDELSKVGIEIDTVTAQLENEGVDKFSVSFDKLIATLERKRTEIIRGGREM
jgi:transaldolase